MVVDQGGVWGQKETVGGGDGWSREIGQVKTLYEGDNESC